MDRKVGKIFEKHMVKFSFSSKAAKISDNPSKHYLFKVNNKNTRRRSKNMFKVNNKDTFLNIFHAFF